MFGINSPSALIIESLFLMISCVYGAPKSQAVINQQNMALSRDGLYRRDPDALLGGFFAAWPFVLLILAGSHLFSVMLLIIFFD